MNPRGGKEGETEETEVTSQSTLPPPFSLSLFCTFAPLLAAAARTLTHAHATSRIPPVLLLIKTGWVTGEENKESRGESEGAELPG